MPTRAARAFSFTSIVLAAGLLVLLLGVSTSGSGEAFRLVNARIQHVHELGAALEERLTAASRDLVDHRESILGIARQMDLTLESIDTDLQTIYQPESPLERARLLAIASFNAIDPELHDLHLGTEQRAAYLQLASAAERMLPQVGAFLQSWEPYADGHRRISEQSLALAKALRSNGKDELADRIFRTSNQMLDYMESGRPELLTQTRDALERLRSLSNELSPGELNLAMELLESAPATINARRLLDESLATMDVPGFESALSSLSDGSITSYVHTLSMINDSRILLNLYTILLLGILFYLTLKLRASHSALNRSHDALEMRVQERTADLAKAYEDLKESQVHLVQAEKMSSLGQLVAGIMHEINTPLLYVSNNTAVSAEVVGELREFIEAAAPLLQDHAEFDTASLLEGANEISNLSRDSLEGLGQISELVLSLKDFSRIDRAAQDRFDVCDGISKTLTITRNLLKNGIEVERRFANVDEIYCSPSRINQVFMNVVTNAAQAMNGKGRLTIGVSQQDDWVEITFEDTGCGIPEENLSKVMDPFFTTKPVGQGTGLGMSIVRQIIDEHQGQIFIDSKVGIGTRVTIGLPKRLHREEEAA